MSAGQARSADVHFLNVGQGSCSVIILRDDDGEGAQAIIVDGGPSGKPLIELLDAEGVQRIGAFVVSHNDADHRRGAEYVLKRFPGRIDSFFFLIDGKHDPLLERVQRRRDEIDFNLLIGRLESDFGGKKRVLWSDPEVPGICLELFFPDFLDNVVAHERGKPNATCGIVAFNLSRCRVVFAGDAPIEAWKKVHEWNGNRPIRCQVLTVPHHGGCIGDRSKDSYTSELKQIFGEIILAEHCIVSVGTENSHGHPFPETISSLRGLRRKIYCTQLTPHCCDDPQQLAPGVLASPDHPGHPPPPSGVACAGTVVALLDGRNVVIRDARRHSSAIDSMLTRGGTHPLCRESP